jgi:dolichol-phosphate mannosyltransferase
MSDRAPDISIIIPTFNERDNIGTVVHDVFAVARARRYAIEIVIVDDNSPDGTGQEAELLAKRFPITVIHREGKKGLGSAVVEGFARARGRIWGMMDADRSHPAEMLPALIEPILEGRAQLTIGSRYMEGGAVEYWPWVRHILSYVATLLGRLFAGGVRDPLSGFLFFDRTVVEGIPLKVTGYKIGLEILVKGRYERVLELPYTFRSREVGHSKLGWSEYRNYLASLVRHFFYCLSHRRRRTVRATADACGALGEKCPARQQSADDHRAWRACPLCGGDNHAYLFVKQTYRHVRCRACGLVFVNPAPTAAEFDAIYQDPRYFANHNEWPYGYNDYFAEREFYVALFDRRVRQIEQALGVASGHGRRLLDVGCAAGFLLEAARERGWSVAGVEVSRHAVEFAREHLGQEPIHNGDLESARFQEAAFDCITMLDVIEHASDPVRLLREAARVLKPGGVLLLSAPNVASLSARVARRRWFHFKRDHVLFFSERTLRGALDGAGLACIALGRNGKMVSLNYLFARTKTYVPLLGKLLLSTAGRLAVSRRLFYDSWTGELLALCRKREEKDAAREKSVVA